MTVRVILADAVRVGHGLGQPGPTLVDVGHLGLGGLEGGAGVGRDDGVDGGLFCGQAAAQHRLGGRAGQSGLICRRRLDGLTGWSVSRSQRSRRWRAHSARKSPAACSALSATTHDRLVSLPLDKATYANSRPPPSSKRWPTSTVPPCILCTVTAYP